MVYMDADETKHVRTIKIPTNDFISITTEIGSYDEYDRVVISYHPDDEGGLFLSPDAHKALKEWLAGHENDIAISDADLGDLFHVFVAVIGRPPK